MGDTVNNGKQDAQAVIFVNPYGYQQLLDGSLGPFICQPEDATVVIVIKDNGNAA